MKLATSSGRLTHERCGLRGAVRSNQQHHILLPGCHCPQNGGHWRTLSLGLDRHKQTLTGLNLFSPDSDQWFRWSPAEGLLQRLELWIQN
eukprot:s2478_g3.t1